MPTPSDFTLFLRISCNDDLSDPNLAGKTRDISVEIYAESPVPMQVVAIAAEQLTKMFISQVAEGPDEALQIFVNNIKNSQVTTLNGITVH